jgi:hypothetical protein
LETVPFFINSKICPEKSPVLACSCFSTKLGNACVKWKAGLWALQIASEAENTKFERFYCEDDISNFVSKLKKWNWNIKWIPEWFKKYLEYVVLRFFPFL